MKLLVTQTHIVCCSQLCSTDLNIITLKLTFGRQRKHSLKIWTSYRGTSDGGNTQRKGQSWRPLFASTLHCTKQGRWKVWVHQMLSLSSEARSGIWQMTQIGRSSTGPCAFAAALAAAVGSTVPPSERIGRAGGGSFGIGITATGASGKLAKRFAGMPPRMGVTACDQYSQQSTDNNAQYSINKK